MRYHLGLATRTQISVCKSPFPSAGTAVSLFRAKTVQQRPLLPRKVELCEKHQHSCLLYLHVCTHCLQNNFHLLSCTRYVSLRQRQSYRTPVCCQRGSNCLLQHSSRPILTPNILSEGIKYTVGYEYFAIFDRYLAISIEY